MTITNPEVLATDLEVLVTHARERYEDSYLLDGVRLFLQHVLAVPDFAWGAFPWSSDWAKKWKMGADPRLAEAVVARDKTQEIAGKLFQVACELADADLQIALDFTDIQDELLKPYIDAVHPPGRTARYVPGTPTESAPMPPDYGGEPDISIPASRDERTRGLALIASRASKELTIRQWVDHLAGGPPPTTAPILREWNELFGNNDSLENFVNEHFGTLTAVENILSAVDPAAMRPMRDFISDAQRSYPRIIDLHANLINVAANVYQQLVGEMDSEKKLLLGPPYGSGEWKGFAANAYGAYVGAHIKWLDQVAAHAYWFAEAGRKAATTIKTLRNEYAQYGAEHISTIISALQDYYDIVEDFWDTSSPKEAAKSLLKAVKDYTDAMLNSRRKAATDAASVYKIEAKAIEGFPLLDDLSHGQTPYPEVGDAKALWARPEGWK